MTTDDPTIFFAAQAMFPLLHEDAPYAAPNGSVEKYGAFADAVQVLRDLHQQAITLSLGNGTVYDVWADARTAWEGMRASDDGSKRYGLLDAALQRIAWSLDDLRDDVNRAEVAQAMGRPVKSQQKPATEYTATPSMPIDVNDLLQMERKQTVWYAPSFVREGLGLLVGQPNVGKTPAAIQLMIALAMGGKWLGTVQCRRARVLYLGMEYSPQELIPMFDISRMGLAIPREQLLVKTIEDEFPTSPEAALEELEWYLRVMEVRVICIDVLTAFLPPEKFKQNVYRGDYSELKPYHRLALKYNAAILGVWHASKRESDPKIMYNGSTGMWAAAASRITMYQDQEQRVRITSFPRMGDRVDWALTQEKTNQGHRWVMADASPEPMCSPSETQVYRFLKEHADKTKPLSPATIAELTGLVPSSVRTHVTRLHERNLLQRLGSGYYVEVVAPVAPETVVAPVAPVALQTTSEVLHVDAAPRADENGVLQVLHATRDPDPFDAFPPSIRMTTRMMIVSDLERNIETAKQRCTEYGLDYETLRKILIERSRNGDTPGTITL